MLAQFSHEWSNQDVFHPVSLVVVLVLGLVILVVDRPKAMLPVILVTMFITVAQRIVIGGFDLTVVRMLLVFGWARIFFRGEHTHFRLRPMDLAVLAWGVVTALAYTALHASHGSAGPAVVNRMGWFLDNIGVYFLFRVLIRDWRDVLAVVRWLAVLALPLLAFFVIERLTYKNLFGFQGGVLLDAWIREGRMRCQGSFSHPILAGCFWGAILPMFLGMLWSPRSRVRGVALLGSCCAIAITALTASSTAAMGVLFAVFGSLMFRMRSYMGLARMALVVVPVGLHMVMQQPVWHLISRLNVIGGSTGWHRFYLIDQCVKHFGDWWLFGVIHTAYWGRGLHDVTNFYVLQAASGGLFTLLAFVLILGLAFRAVGRIMRAADQPMTVILGWQLGVCIFVSCMNFTAVSYAHKPLLLFLMQLAAIASLEQLAVQEIRVAARRRRLAETVTATGACPAPSAVRTEPC